jgi:hypothetical protein
MFNVYWISTIGVGVLSVWPIFVFLRRWWIKPYRNPQQILTRIQRSLRLSSSETRQVYALLGADQDPIKTSQFLLDSTRWPASSQDESTKKLYSKVFKEP